MNKTITLKNGVEIPILGIGTASMDNEETFESVLYALEIGYRQ